MSESRVSFLELCLRQHQFPLAYKALLLVKREMCEEKGFTRHNGTHYYYHCVDVAIMLMNEGVDNEDTIAASILHDIVEDVHGFTIESIKNMFNENIARKVSLLTKDSSVNYKIHPEKFEEDLEEMSKDVGVSLIKAADRLHNINTLLDCTPEKQLRKALETEKYFIPFFKKCRELYPWYSGFFFIVKTQVEHTISRIKQNHEEVEKLNNEISELKQKLEEVKRR